MRIFNWVQGKINNNGIVSHQRGISVANEIVDTRVVDSVNLEGLDDILAIGTFGFDQSNPFSSETEEEIADSKSLVVTCEETEEIADSKLLVVECCQETEARLETEAGLETEEMTDSKSSVVATANEVCLFDKEMLKENDEESNAEKKNKMTLSDLFLADDYFFRNPNNIGNITSDVKKPSDCSDNYEERVKTVHTSTPPTASAALVETKDKKPSCSFIQKLPIPCMTAGKDSSCFLYPRLPTRKLHRMMAKMLKKKKKIHPAATQHDGEVADSTESKIIKDCH